MIKLIVLARLHAHPLLQPRGDLDTTYYVELAERVAGGDINLGGEPFFVSPLYADADGTYSAVEGITPSIRGQVRDARRVAEAAAGRALSEGEVSGYFYDRAFDWIASHTMNALTLFARKVAYTLNATDLALNHSYTYFSRDAVATSTGIATDRATHSHGETREAAAGLGWGLPSILAVTFLASAVLANWRRGLDDGRALARGIRAAARPDRLRPVIARQLRWLDEALRRQPAYEAAQRLRAQVGGTGH